MATEGDSKRYELSFSEPEMDVVTMAVEIALEDAKALVEDVGGFVPLKEGLVENAEDFLAAQTVASDNATHLKTAYDKLIAEGGEQDDDHS